MSRIAVTGTASFLGARVLRRLVELRGGEAIVAVDVAPPPSTLQGVTHRRLDLTEPASDQRLVEIFQQEGVDTVLHMALFTSPQRDKTHAHELESIGSLSVFAAAAAAGVKHLLLRSFTAVYGARGQNPNFLTEDRALQPNLALGWARDKLEAEQHAAAFAKRYPEMAVTVLRTAPLFGPGVHTFYTALFDRRLVPVLMGYDPLVQLLHPDDAVVAFERALDKRPRGAFNVVPRTAIPLLTALHLSGKVTLPVLHPIAYALADGLWALGLGEGPGAFLDYARYLFVADGQRAKRELGFEARYGSREALDAYLRYRHPEGGALEPVEARA